MLFWLAAAFLTLISIALVAPALLRHRQMSVRSEDYDLEVYRDQLAELHRNREQGLILPDEEKAAEVELSRRILDADRRRTAGEAGQGVTSSLRGKGPMRWLTVALVAGLPAAAVSLYLFLGAPHSPAQPFAEREEERRLAAEAMERQRLASELDPEEQRAMIEAMVEGLAARLQEQPNDLEGWLRLARSYQVLGRPDAEREALEEAVKIAPDSIPVLVLYTRSLRAAAGNRDTAESIEVMRRIVELDPTNPEALWFLAAAAAAEGRYDEARTLFDRALAGLPANDEGHDELRAMADRILEGAESRQPPPDGG